MPSDTTEPTAKVAPKRDAVEAAFAELIQELGARAMRDPQDHEAFERAASFRRKVIDLSARWSDGRPATTPRGGAAKAEG